MQTANDYDKEVFNGDLGFVSTIDADAQEVTITFDGRDVVYQFGELDEVSLAFSTTIHKSQGSEYPAVVIPVGMTHYMMLRRNLIYTGVTRGKKLVVLVGQRKAVGIAVRSAEGGRRWSKLRELLKQGSALHGASSFASAVTGRFQLPCPASAFEGVYLIIPCSRSTNRQCAQKGSC